MKKIVFILFILKACFCFSQIKTIHVAKEKEPEVFTLVEEQAEYPGGIAEMSNFIRKNLVFPSRAKTDSTFIGCKVFIKFIVNEDGLISDAMVLKGCDRFPECDEESIRVVKSMPKWKPAKLGGRTVKCYYNLPLTFKIK